MAHLGLTFSLALSSDMSLDGDAVSNYHCRLVTVLDLIVM